MKELILKIAVPEGEVSEITCDSVHLTVTDGKNGKGAGSYGIRYGHVKALISLGKGKITAFSSGEAVFSAECEEGFATVEKDSVSVMTPKCTVL